MKKLRFTPLLVFLAFVTFWTVPAHGQGPILNGIQPNTGLQGATHEVTLSGSGFATPASLSITGGSGIIVSSVTVLSPTSALATLVLSATPGDYSLRLAGPGGTSAPQTFTVRSSAVTGSASFEVTAYAGPDGGPGSRDGAAVDARFNGPISVTGDGAYLYIADGDNLVIRRVTIATGQVATLAGALQTQGSADGVGSAAKFGFPYGIWADGTNAYISDLFNRTIRKINLATGAVTTIAGTAGAPVGNIDANGASARFVGPTGIWGDATSLYVADSYNTTSRSIRKITLATGDVTTIAILNNVQAAPDLGVGLWGDGANLYIADSSRHTIRRLVLASGTLTTLAGLDLVPGDADGASARFDSPSAIWGDATTLYVADTNNFTIRRVTISTGEASTIVGLPGSSSYNDGAGLSARLGYITGVWGSGSTVYLMDNSNHAVRFLNVSTNTVGTIAGKPSLEGSTDATGLNAGFASPINVWGDGKFIFVADTGNSTVRKIVPSTGQVTTLAGSPGTLGAVDGQGAAARFRAPLGLWGDGQTLYLTDYSSDTIRRIIVGSGTVTTIAGSATAASGSQDGVGTAARFTAPWGIWGDGTNLYVTDELNFTIRKIVIATLQVTTFAGAARSSGVVDGVGTGARFVDPTAIWGDGTYLYIIDGHAIRRITLATAQVTTIAGDAITAGFVDGRGSAARFDAPSGIWGDGSSLFIADTVNALIRKLEVSTQTVTTILGQYPYYGSENGRGTAARFYYPSGIWGDGANLYVSDFGIHNVRRATPSFTELVFNLTDRMTLTRTTTGGATLQTGFARILPNNASTTPSGMAIFSYRTPDGVLASEAAVPASPLIQSGRIFAEVAAPVNTGLAIANANDQAVTVNFYFTDASGANVNSGSTVIPAYGQLAKFLDQEPYTTAGTNLANVRTFTFMTTLPVSVIALRGLTNERNEFLMTTLPVVPVSPTDTAPIVFSHFADGGGWTTQIMLVNSGDDTLSGTIEFFTRGTTSTPGAPASVTAGGVTSTTFPYSIPARGAFRLRTAGTATGDNSTGWVRVTPNSGGRAPVGLLVFSFRPATVTLSESGVPAVPAGSAFRIYAEASGNFVAAAPGSIQTGLAISNPSNSNVTVNLELIRLDGSSTGFTASVTIPARGQVARFLNEIPGLSSVPLPFQGLLRVSGASVAVVGLRSRYNELGAFVISTTSPVNESSPAPLTEFVFPHLADGGGYTTQLILFSGSGGQAANGLVRFYSVIGQPLNVNFQ